MDEYNTELYDKIDPITGKRYRKIGNIMEYEPEVSMSFGTMSISQVEKARENAKKYQLQEVEKVETRSCPFKHNSVRINCVTDCVLYINGKCTLSELGASDKTADTTNKKCPFSGRTCRSDCFLNNSGCVLAKLKR